MSSVEAAGDTTWGRILLIIVAFLAIVVTAGIGLIVFSDLFIAISS